MSRRIERKPARPAFDEHIGIETIRFETGGLVVQTRGMIDDGEGNYYFDYNEPIHETIIRGEALAEILSANPSWAPGKPADKFQVDDLWYILDEIKEGRLNNESV